MSFNDFGYSVLCKILKENITYKINSVMELFNYRKCEGYMKQQDTINVELSNILPSNVRSKIAEDNIYVIDVVKQKETSKSLRKGILFFYLQLRLFLFYNKKPMPEENIERFGVRRI